MSRTPPGVRELKPASFLVSSVVGVRRTPPGVRELKLQVEQEKLRHLKSHPSRGA